MANQVICIVGPTGVGKTKRALEESIRVPSILVSADSRQVYRGMDIVTGKDHPKDQQIYGIDLVNPDDPCSVAVWYDSVSPHIQNADPSTQIVVVGGTGLYVKALTHGIDTISVPINQVLRDSLEPLSLEELQLKLQELNPSKFIEMNHSDQCNPRRLIRAIEVASFPYKGPTLAKSVPLAPPASIKIIGLRMSDESIYRHMVKARVLARLAGGAVEETQSLLVKYDQSLPSFSAIGYRSIIAYLSGKLTREEMIEAWTMDELRYAKRQLTWFRRVKQVEWYDVSTIGAK